MSGEIGDIVEVAISVANNPGITCLGFSVDFDDTALALVALTNSGLLSGANHAPVTGTSPCKLAWQNGTATKDNTDNGEIIVLEFEILQGAELGEHEITLSYKPNNILDSSMQPVYFDIEGGSVTVTP